MKKIPLLIFISVMISSCSEEEKQSITTWEAISLTVDASPVALIPGISLSPDFISVGKDLDYELTLDDTENTWEVSGDYTLFTEFENEFIPDVEESFVGKTKSGFFTVSENGYLFDNSLYDIEVNDMVWSKDDGKNIEFLLNKSGDRLIQSQTYMNIKVNQLMNASLEVKTEWRKK